MDNNIVQKLDDILWVVCEKGKEKLCFYMLAPHLHEDNLNYYAKLVYKTSEPFSSGNIIKQKNDEKWFKTIHRFEKSKKVSLPDKDIQRIALKYGFKESYGFWKNLSSIPKKEISEIISPPKLIDVYNKNSLKSVLPKISNFYQVPVSDIKVSGSAGFFAEPITKLNDLDIIIPINSNEQLSFINKFKIPDNSTHIKLKEKNWPIRWAHNSGLIICPFFIYGDIDQPIKGLEKTGNVVKGKIEITNSDYGLFNIPLYECRGVTNKILIKSSFIRGIVEVGMHFYVDCPTYKITKGLWEGDEIAMFRDQQIEELKNLLYIKAA